MNLSKLFEIQAELDKPYQNVPDRLSKDILWLQTELGELANEWRGFRYRRHVSEQTPLNYCQTCQLTSVPHECKNPLLDEYTDALSVLLSIGIQVNGEEVDVCDDNTKHNPLETFIEMYGAITELNSDIAIGNQFDIACSYDYAVNLFIGLGEKFLGFTWDEIETSYMEKAEANKRRNFGGMKNA